MVLAILLVLAPVASAQIDQRCASQDASAVVVCGKAPQPYRIDPNVTAGERLNDRDQDNASAATPAAQAACARSPMGCTKGLGSLDLANVAMVVGAMAVRAVRKQDWRKPLRPGGPGEYQRYKEAKQQREEEAANRAARQLRDTARAGAEQ